MELAARAAVKFSGLGCIYLRVSGGEPVSHEFDDIGGPFETEQEAVENALHWLHAWAEL